ncbi:MAG: hypothetical protein A2017_13270, partial [Lentisphaerae bacterium GWF2_44_16]
GFLDIPDKQAHKKHAKAIPLLGGLAVFLSWAITIGFGYFAVRFLDISAFAPTVSSNLPGIITVSNKIFFICAAAFLSLVLGLYDDRCNMRALTKLGGQFLIAAIAVSFGGVRITLFFNEPVITWCVTVFWFLLVINSINFFDNMDGLATGVAAIALCFFTIVAGINQQYFVAAMSAAGAGAAIGFWFYNHSPASIFLGDAGSHLLGYILAVASASVTYYHSDVSTTHFPVLIPVFILAIPLFDTAAVVMIRLYNRKPVYIGDHNHISHRFVSMGMSRKKAVFLIHLLVLIIGLSVLPLLWGDERSAVVSIVQAATLLVFVSVLQYSSISGKAKSRGE